MAAPILAMMGGAAMMAVTLGSQGYKLGGSPATEYNKRLVRKLYKTVWNEKDTKKMEAAVENLIEEDHVVVDPSNPNPVDGVDAYKEMVKSFRHTMPNVSVQIDMLIAEGSKVVALLTFNSGVVPDNTKTAVWTATGIMEFAGGQVVKTWVNSDALSALIQLGLVPDMASGPFPRPQGGLTTGGPDALPKMGSVQVIDALLGRNAAHPQEVLTGAEWLDYFLEQAEKASSTSAAHKQLQKDLVSGLDMAI